MTNSAFPYRITELLHKSERLALYRALHEPDRVPVILKVLDPRYSRPRDLAQLKNEYALGASLDTEAGDYFLYNQLEATVPVRPELRRWLPGFDL